MPTYPSATHPQRRQRFLSRCAALIALAVLAGCERPAADPPRSGIGEALGDVSFEVPRGEGRDRQVVQGRQGVGGRPPAPPPQIYPGSNPYGGDPASARVPGAQQVGGGVQLNFDGADMREVVDVVLGDVLGVSYTIDPAVQGQVVLSSAGPLNARDLLAVLESALAINGATLVRVADEAFAVRLLGEDPAGGPASVSAIGDEPIDAPPGSGVTVVPLRFISAETAAQFVDPLVGQPEQIRTDENRNLLLFVGSGAERQAVLDLLREIDVNWMAGRAAGVFPLDVATPGAIIPELESLFAPLATPELGTETVRFVPVGRLNAVLAVAATNEQIQEVARWVRRLDRGSAQEPQFFVYQLQNAPADEVAGVLGQILGDDGAGVGVLEEEFVETFDDPGFDDVPPSAFVDEEVDVDLLNNRRSVLPGRGPGVAEAPQAVTGELDARDSLLGPVRVVPNARNNTLIVRATPRAYGLIEATLRRIDTPPLQVIVEATIAEVTLTDQLRYGVQYFFESGDFAGGFNTTGQASTGVTGFDNLNPLAQVPGFNFIYNGGDVTVAIDALSRLTDVRVLSSPSVVVQDNREATLLVGNEVPVVTQAAQDIEDINSIVSNVEYRDTGVILAVRPRISSNDNISLVIAQEVSRVLDATDVFGNPSFSQRRITSEVNVLSGQTVVLGGLIEDSESVSRNKVPLLGDIPLLGNLFRSNDISSARTELIVFLTPRVIRDAQDARDISRELRDRLRSLRPVGTIEPPARTPGLLEDDETITLPGDPAADPDPAIEVEPVPRRVIPPGPELQRELEEDIEAVPGPVVPAPTSSTPLPEAGAASPAGLAALGTGSIQQASAVPPSFEIPKLPPRAVQRLTIMPEPRPYRELFAVAAKPVPHGQAAPAPVSKPVLDLAPAPEVVPSNEEDAPVLTASADPSAGETRRIDSSILLPRRVQPSAADSLAF